jgi:hypothetical protein
LSGFVLGVVIVNGSNDINALTANFIPPHATFTVVGAWMIVAIPSAV